MVFHLVPAFIPFKQLSKRYKFSYGGRGGSKSISIADILILKARESKEKILCAREIQKSIKDSVHALIAERIKHYKLDDEFEILNNEIRHRITGSVFLFTGLREHNIETIKSYQGVTVCWVEESQSVTQKSLTILTPTIRQENSEIWFSYNRMTDLDPVEVLRMKECKTQRKKKFTRKSDNKTFHWVEYEGEDAVAIYINYDGNPYFPEVLEKERAKDEIDNPKLYLHKWLGYPADQAEDTLISRELALKASKREITDSWDKISIGVDPARFGDDESVIFLRKGMRVMPAISFNGIDTVRLSGEILSIVRAIRAEGYKEKIQIKVDDTGIGGGVTDSLRQYEIKSGDQLQPEETMETIDKNRADRLLLNIQVIPVMNNAAASDPKYKNYGAQMWGEMKEALKTMAIPYDIDLIHQMTTRKYKITPDGKIELESKKDMKKRGLKSPDRPDALGLCLAESHTMAFEEMDKISFAKRQR